MKILDKYQNKYKRNFITISIDGNESFTGNIYKHGTDYSIYVKDKSNHMHELRVKRYVSRNWVGEIVKDYGTYCVGNGSGCFMGWKLDLTKREAFKIARALCATAQQFKLIARITVQD